MGEVGLAWASPSTAGAPGAGPTQHGSRPGERQVSRLGPGKWELQVCTSSHTSGSWGTLGEFIWFQSSLCPAFSLFH